MSLGARVPAGGLGGLSRFRFTGSCTFCCCSSQIVTQNINMRIGKNEYIDFNPRPTVPYCNCFPLYVGRLKITVFHFLFSCTMIFSLLWGYLIYCAVVAAVYGERTIVAQDSEENINSAMVDANY